MDLVGRDGCGPESRRRFGRRLYGGDREYHARRRGGGGDAAVAEELR